VSTKSFGRCCEDAQDMDVCSLTENQGGKRLTHVDQEMTNKTLKTLKKDNKNCIILHKCKYNYKYKCESLAKKLGIEWFTKEWFSKLDCL